MNMCEDTVKKEFDSAILISKRPPAINIINILNYSTTLKKQSPINKSLTTSVSSLIVRTQSLHLPYQWPMQTCLAVTCYRSSQQAPPIFCTTQLRFEGPSSLALTYPALSLCFLPVNDDEKACHIPKYWNKVTLDYFIAQVLHTTVYYSILQYITVYYSILQYITVYYRVPCLLPAPPVFVAGP